MNNEGSLRQGTVADLGGEGANTPTLAASNYVLLLHKSIKWLCSSGMQQQQPGSYTLMYQFWSPDIWLGLAWVASRYSVWTSNIFNNILVATCTCRYVKFFVHLLIIGMEVDVATNFKRANPLFSKSATGVGQLCGELVNSTVYCCVQPPHSSTCPLVTYHEVGEYWTFVLCYISQSKIYPW